MNDTCFLCLQNVDSTKWREHMDEYHHVVNNPKFEEVLKEAEEYQQMLNDTEGTFAG